MKKFCLLVLLSVLLCYLFFNRFAVQFVWVNPHVNTDVFPYIAKALRSVDNALNHTVLSMKSSKLDVKIIYRNAYGSGFLKNNPIPNDLDYSIGVHLGEYEFDGTNAEEIATAIDEKMTIFQTEFYNYINNFAMDKFYTNYDVLSSLQTLFSKRENNINSISSTIPYLFKHKDYVNYTEKIMYDENDEEFKMTFPFILKQNEILIEDYSPIILFSNIVKYSPETRDFLRELSIVTDFYVDIKKGDDLVQAEIVAESFSGQRLQLTRRFFVPIVFAGNSSAKYLKKLPLLTNDQTYVEYRLFNFRRHLQEFSNLKEMHERPIKLFKRVLQCVELIYPLLDNATLEDITTTISLNLYNPKIQLINDYQTAYSNLIQISAMPKLYLKAQYYNKVTEHIAVMLDIVEDMKNSKLFSQKELDLIVSTTVDLQAKAKFINSEETLNKFKKQIMNASSPLFETLEESIDNTVFEKEKILAYIDTFNNLMLLAGFHKIDICWLEKDLLGVVKDEFTSTIAEKELKNMAKANKLADVDYKFINKSELSGPKVRYSVWVRYNSSEEENSVWELMQNKLIQDKDNFDIKRRIILSLK